MTQLISAIFATAAEGAAAAQVLTTAYADSPLRLLTPQQAGAGIAAHLVIDGHSAADAARFARAVAGGNTYLSVKAGWGTAKRATRILRGAGALRIESRTPAGEEFGISEASPLSDTFFLPVLSNNPTPMSSFWGLQVLANTYSFSAKIHLPLLARNGTLLSSLFHLPTLTRMKFFFPTRRTV